LGPGFALSYAALRGLLYPQKSSVYRRIAGLGSTVAKATGLATVVVAEYQALWDEMRASYQGRCKLQEVGTGMLRWLGWVAAYIVGGIALAAAGLWAVSLTAKSGAEVVGRWGGLVVSGVVVFTLAARTPHAVSLGDTSSAGLCARYPVGPAHVEDRHLAWSVVGPRHAARVVRRVGALT
jgi:hypothetical protein